MHLQNLYLKFLVKRSGAIGVGQKWSRAIGMGEKWSRVIGMGEKWSGA
jgi:hypothetical protein